LLHVCVNVEVDGRSFGPPLRSTDKSETMPLLMEMPQQSEPDFAQGASNFEGPAQPQLRRPVE
jgi:hypothetical protein